MGAALLLEGVGMTDTSSKKDITMENAPNGSVHPRATDPVGAVMVLGGGIAGMQASLDLAASGYYVHLVEQSSAIGGLMSQLDKTFPTNDCAM
jgi:heterodisulfide reductase subunit A